MQTQIGNRTALYAARKDWARPAAPLLAAVLLGVICPGGVSGKEDSTQPAAASGPVIIVPLEYQETRFQFMFRDVPVERRPVPFAKEPAPATGPVVRGLLKFGNNPSNAIPFIWQGGAKKLFLDLNRNQDLTDDPAGVYAAQLQFSAAPSFLHQMFTNVPLSFPASSAGAPMRVDLCFFMDNYRHPGQAICNAALRSYWQGKVSPAGQDWQVGLLPNLSDEPGSFQHGQLLLRPWEERNRPFTAACEKPLDSMAVAWEGKNLVVRASEAFAFSPRVFFEGHAWQLDWNAEPRGPEEKLALRLSEQPAALGELRITGSFIRRLVLTGGPYVVVLAKPEATLKVPTGRYHPYRVWLDQGKAQAYFNFGLPQSGAANIVEDIGGSQLPVLSPPPPEQAVEVGGQRAAVLAVGGPLTNYVSAVHRGRNLLLSYRLIGAGGGEYRLAGGGDGKPPRFTAERSGKRIGAGQFEFG